jgi:tetratricopeptide (TPR) repeat protein
MRVSEEFYKKGLTHAKIEDYEEAIKCFDKAIQIDPNNALAWISKANALIECGNGEEAKSCLDKANKIDSKYDFSQTKNIISRSESSDRHESSQI